MKKGLIIGKNRFLNDDLSDVNVIQVKQDINLIKDNLNKVDFLLFDLDEVDADLITEDVIDVVLKNHNKFDKIIYLTRLGIDLEYDDQSFSNQQIDYQEYLKQQRYAIKLIDELEQPYTIIRIPELKESLTRNPTIVSEGKEIKSANVSHETITDILVKVILTNDYDNQSIAVLDD
ncbi:NAD(P)H-binding protein [Lactobacillus sp. S2-2]|uniref:NAD(P)H-binding protein n=1 Tax=Lactobacillus sp. S2-2 TaxID=2692917 RepID=UPI001F27E960|nr:NAD(P)H-binding protein [Lactobacillus sp. S2-2]MCF6515410.1 NAD(P)H-binding protein [Lactobacillus sp. S2-2]